MNETSSTQTDPNRPGEPGGPRVSRDQVRDIDRLRRTTGDRYIAGVAGGLGRHFDVDPTIIRVALVVLSFFGGAGLLLYGAAWIFVPDDGDHRAPIDMRPDVRRAVLIGVAVVAGLIFLGTTFSDNSWGWGFPIPVVVLAVIAIVVFATRDRRRDETPPPAPWGSATSPEPGAQPQEGTTMSVTDAPTGAATSPGYGQPPPAWMPPTRPAYVPPTRPRRTGMVLFWPTLALIAIALGSLGIYDIDNRVYVSAYAALALAITGVMLLVGAFIGRPGGLIALGLAGSLGLAVTSAVDVVDPDGDYESRTMEVTPRTPAALQDSYSTGTGTIRLDLTQLQNTAALDGRSLDVSLNAGEIVIVVPRTVNAEVDADVRFAGRVIVGDEIRDGFGQSIRHDLDATASDAPTIEIEVDARVGQITVTQD